MTNLLLIVLFVVFGLIWGPHQSFDTSMGFGNIGQVFSSAFAISLVYVSYSYSGWNSSAYIAGEIDNPEKNLPLSLFWGTSIVTLLYLALNFTFLYTVPISDLAGKVEVGHVAANAIWGMDGAKIVSTLIALGLLASVNAMSLIGPRVTKTIAHDFRVLDIFTKETKTGNPFAAQLLQTCVALILVHTSTFEHVMAFIGFTLSLFTCLTVGGVFVLRKKFPTSSGFKTWAYPITPLFFLLVDVLMMAYVFFNNPWQSLAGLGTALLGAVVYYLSFKNEAQ